MSDYMKRSVFGTASEADMARQRDIAREAEGEPSIKLIHDQMMDALHEARRTTDCGIAHIQADAALCEMLGALGYGDLVEEWHKVRKWYA